MKFVAAVFLFLMVFALPAIADAASSDQTDGWGVNVNGTFFVPLEETLEWMGEDATCLSGKQVFLLRGGKGYPMEKDKFFIVQAITQQKDYNSRGKIISRFAPKPFAMVSLRALAEFFGYEIKTYSNFVVMVGNQKEITFIQKDYLQFHFHGLRGQGRFADFVFPISGAGHGYKTPRGWFWVYYKHKNHRSSKYPRPHGGASMPYSLFFYQGTAYHVGIVGAASHGCIHGRRSDAIKLWQIAPTKTLVCVSG